MPRRICSRQTLLHIVLIAALAGAVGGLSLRAVDRESSPTTDTVATPPRTGTVERPPLFESRPRLLVISDSIAGGPAPATVLYPDVIGDTMQWDVSIDAVGARGFLPTDLSNIGVKTIVPPFIEQLDDNVRNFRADVIIVDGGRNDLGKNPVDFAAAYDDYMTKLRAAFPRAKVMALVPSYISPQKASLYEPNSAAVRRSAAKIGAHVLDPYAERWYVGVDLAKIRWPDAIHLNDEGARFYAAKVIDGMRRAGVAVQP